MKSVDRIYESEYVINKSRFLSFIFPVSTEEDCKMVLDEYRYKFHDATHVCFAYILNNPSIEKCSDDGEPSGTAGKPMLELLKKRNLNNTLLIVVRYFGGIKLGAGGLVRAYTNASNLVINEANIIEKILLDKYEIVLHLSELKDFEKIINNQGKILSTEYSDVAKITFLCEDITKVPYNYIEISRKIGSEWYGDNN